jgi:hypothetical protein
LGQRLEIPFYNSHSTIADGYQTKMLSTGRGKQSKKPISKQNDLSFFASEVEMINTFYRGMRESF